MRALRDDEQVEMAAVDGGTRITLWYRTGGYTPDDVSKLAPVADRVQALQLGGLANYVRDQAANLTKQPR
jgi:hypothetical protein